MKLELITAEGPATLWMRKGRLIRFPQLTMPLLAALTPEDVEIHHTDEIVSQLSSISRRLLAGSRTGLWWNLPRNLGYKMAFDKLGRRGFNPVGQLRHTPSQPVDSLAELAPDMSASESVSVCCDP